MGLKYWQIMILVWSSSLDCVWTGCVSSTAVHVQRGLSVWKSHLTQGIVSWPHSLRLNYTHGVVHVYLSSLCENINLWLCFVLKYKLFFAFPGTTEHNLTVSCGHGIWMFYKALSGLQSSHTFIAACLGCISDICGFKTAWINVMI